MVKCPNLASSLRLLIEGCGKLEEPCRVLRVVGAWHSTLRLDKPVQSLPGEVQLSWSIELGEVSDDKLRVRERLGERFLEGQRKAIPCMHIHTRKK